MIRRDILDRNMELLLDYSFRNRVVKVIEERLDEVGRKYGQYLYVLYDVENDEFESLNDVTTEYMDLERYFHVCRFEWLDDDAYEELEELDVKLEMEAYRYFSDYQEVERNYE